MIYVTHVLGGVALGAAAIVISPGNLEPGQVVAVLAGAGVGGLLPDIDHPWSKISKANIFTSLASGIILRFSKHRGFFHTPLFMFTVFLIIGWLMSDTLRYAYTYPYFICMGIILGMLSHLLLDSLNPSGIMWGYPSNKKYYNFMSIRTGSLKELLVAAILAIMIMVLLPYTSR